MKQTDQITDLVDEVARDVGWLKRNTQQQAGKHLSAVARARSTAPVIVTPEHRVRPDSGLTLTDARYGMSVATNGMVVGIEHVKQSIRDILLTPLGSRVMRREYGSELFDLIDAPMNAAGKLKLYQATAAAISRWEPRVSLQRIRLDANQLFAGRLLLTLTWVLRPAFHWMLQREPHKDSRIIHTLDISQGGLQGGEG